MEMALALKVLVEMISAPASRNAAMDGGDRLGLGDREQIVAALQIARMIGELLSAEFRLAEIELLDHRAHRPVEDQDPLGN